SLQAAAYDEWLPAFDPLIPVLLGHWEALPEAHPLRRRLGEQVAMLRDWPRRWSVDSEATSLAIFWATELHQRASGGVWGPGLTSYAAMAALPAQAQLEALADASDRLEREFGSW